MTTPTRKLGRGLTSLLSAPVSVAPLRSATESTDRSRDPADGEAIQQISLHYLIPNIYQPRRQFEASSLERLAESIRSAGVMQPILVRPAAASGEGNGEPRYEIVAGERRFRAAGLAGLPAIPAIVVNITDEESAEWALIENMQRDDLATMEKAEALRALTERFNLTHAQAAERVGLDRSSVTNLIRLTELEPEIVALLDQKRLTLGHGKALLAIASGPGRVELARRAAEEEWSVRKLERTGAVVAAGQGRARDAGSPRSTRALEHEAGVRDLEQQLAEHFGTKVELSVSGRGDKGRVIISFYDLDHFDSLMAKMGFRPR
ncbi:MAG: ParB/RepB/Spo0J family partition protein [Phycisphaerales bacterium]